MIYLFVENTETEYWTDDIPFYSKSKDVLKKRIVDYLEPKVGTIRFNDDEANSIQDFDNDTVGWIREISEEVN